MKPLTFGVHFKVKIVKYLQTIFCVRLKENFQIYTSSKGMASEVIQNWSTFQSLGDFI